MRRSVLLASVAAMSVPCALLAPVAHGGGYVVNACNASGGPSSSWETQVGSVNTYKICPAGSAPGDSSNHGMVTRATDRTFAQGAFSRLWFYAPHGTTLTGLNWHGRWNRNHPSWAAQIRAQGGADTRVTGVAPYSGTDSYSGGFGLISYPLPAGTTRLLQNTQCGAGSCPPGATFHTFHASVSVNDPQAPGVSQLGGGLGGGRWVNRDETLNFLATDNVGIRDASLSVAGRSGGSQAVGCDYTRAKPGNDLQGALGFSTDQLPDGQHPLRIAVTDCAGNPGHTDATVKVDNTPPGRVSPAVVGGDGWRQDNRFDARWSNRYDGFAPIVRARYELCRAGGSCLEGVREGSNVSELEALTVTEPGDHLLRVRLEDEAGNIAAESEAAHLRFDPDPPRLAFAESVASDPLRVVVSTSDEASGTSGGQIELRREGGKIWHELETTLEGTDLVAYVDDERFRDGSYEFRAHAIDHAGNTRSTDQRAGGSRATLRLPVRFATRLRAGVRRVRVKRRVVRRNGRRRVARRRVVSFRSRARVGLGRRIRLGGVLTNRDGQPIDGARIEVLGRPRYGRRGFVPVGRAETDRRGRFTYVAQGRFSRVLRFRYEGSSRIRAATDEFVMVVPARSTITSDKRTVLNGNTLLFGGRLRGGRIPSEGKLTFLQAIVRGRWRTFATPRAQPNGRWSFRYRFGATTGLVRYRFRLCVPHDTGYPFDTGCSRAISIAVRGP